MDEFEASKPEGVHQSLGNAWASFLSAQHCTREIGVLRKTLHEHAQQTNLSIASLQTDVKTRHNLVVAVIEESKSKIEQHAADLKETATLRTSLSVLQSEIDQIREDGIKRVKELSENLVAQQEGIDGLRSTASQDVTDIQAQCCLALERVELLQGELARIKAEKMALDQRLATLERQVITTTHTNQALPEGTVNFLEDILSRRDDLMRLLDKQAPDIPPQNLAMPSKPWANPLSQTPAVPQGRSPQDQSWPPSMQGAQQDRGEENNPAVPPKRKAEEQLESQRRRGPATTDTPSQDIRSLYLLFRDRYKANPPRSDATFIWDFISSIENPAMSKHVQESLAAVLPQHITPSRDTRRKNPRRHIDISKGLTWRKFREALVKIPGPS